MAYTLRATKRGRGRRTAKDFRNIKNVAKTGSLYIWRNDPIFLPVGVGPGHN